VFDLARYKAQVAPLAFDDLDLDTFRDRPLDAASIRCVRYMHDVEFHTVCYLRDLLLTRAHRDPDITGFLGFWVFEEFWHGEALAAVLAAHGEASESMRVEAVRQELGWRDRVRPALMSLGSAVARGDFIAIHMAWGAINEWTTQGGYALLARHAAHPTLTELLQRIMRQEGRHIDFYASQACQRLEESVRARRLTRFAPRWLWRPVGSGVMPRAETDFLVGHLMSDGAAQKVVARIDRNIDRLPGLSGLGLVARAVATHENIAA